MSSKNRRDRYSDMFDENDYGSSNDYDYGDGGNGYDYDDDSIYSRRERKRDKKRNRRNRQQDDDYSYSEEILDDRYRRDDQYDYARSGSYSDDSSDEKDGSLSYEGLVDDLEQLSDEDRQAMEELLREQAELDKKAAQKNARVSAELNRERDELLQTSSTGKSGTAKNIVPPAPPVTAAAGKTAGTNGKKEAAAKDAKTGTEKSAKTKTTGSKGNVIGKAFAGMKTGGKATWGWLVRMLKTGGKWIAVGAIWLWSKTVLLGTLCKTSVAKLFRKKSKYTANANTDAKEQKATASETKPAAAKSGTVTSKSGRSLSDFTKKKDSGTASNAKASASASANSKGTATAETTTAQASKTATSEKRPSWSARFKNLPPRKKSLLIGSSVLVAGVLLMGLCIYMLPSGSRTVAQNTDGKAKQETETTGKKDTGKTDAAAGKKDTAQSAPSTEKKDTTKSTQTAEKKDAPKSEQSAQKKDTTKSAQSTEKKDAAKSAQSTKKDAPKTSSTAGKKDAPKTAQSTEKKDTTQSVASTDLPSLELPDWTPDTQPSTSEPAQSKAPAPTQVKTPAPSQPKAPAQSQAKASPQPQTKTPDPAQPADPLADLGLDSGLTSELPVAKGSDSKASGMSGDSAKTAANAPKDSKAAPQPVTPPSPAADSSKAPKSTAPASTSVADAGLPGTSLDLDENAGFPMTDLDMMDSGISGSSSLDSGLDANLPAFESAASGTPQKEPAAPAASSAPAPSSAPADPYTIGISNLSEPVTPDGSAAPINQVASASQPQGSIAAVTNPNPSQPASSAPATAGSSAPSNPAGSSSSGNVSAADPFNGIDSLDSMAPPYTPPAPDTDGLDSLGLSAPATPAGGTGASGVASKSVQPAAEAVAATGSKSGTKPSSQSNSPSGSKSGASSILSSAPASGTTAGSTTAANTAAANSTKGSTSAGNSPAGSPFASVSDVPQGKRNAKISNDTVYIVQEGDKYWDISQKIYGTGTYFEALARYNSVSVPDPNHLTPGTTLLIPDVKFLHQTYPSLCPAEPPKTRKGTTYVVQNGDTLSNIARTQLGSASRWPEIYRMNREVLNHQFDTLEPGTQLNLPQSETAVASEAETSVWK